MAGAVVGGAVGLACRRRGQTTWMFLDNSGSYFQILIQLWNTVDGVTCLLCLFDREGSGNPLQCSCLENPMDGEAWEATIHGVTKSQT